MNNGLCFLAEPVVILGKCLSCSAFMATYTQIKEEMLKKAIVDLEGVFKKRAGKEQGRTEQQPCENGSQGCCLLLLVYNIV